MLPGRYIVSIVLLLAGLVAAAGVDAQTKRRTRTPVRKTAAVPVATPSPSPEPPVVVKTEPKKNERPGAETGTMPIPAQAAIDPTYFYEFAQPEFLISKMVIEHD